MCRLFAQAKTKTKCYLIATRKASTAKRQILHTLSEHSLKFILGMTNNILERPNAIKNILPKSRPETEILFFYL